MEKKALLQEQLVSLARNRLEYLTPNDWALLVDKGQGMSFRRGEILLQPGKQGRTIHLLVKGKARVETSSRGVVARIGPGDICGEMAFLESSTASAVVVAEEDTETCAIEWAALTDLFELFPHLASRFYRSLAVNLSRRLRDQIGRQPGTVKASSEQT